MIKKGKRVAAAAMAVAMSVATVTTSVIPYGGIHLVKAAEENTEGSYTYVKASDSSVDDFSYYLKTYSPSGYQEYICTTDKTYVFTSYDEAIKEVAKIAKKIFRENKYASYLFKIPVEIKTDHKIDQIENNQDENDVKEEIYKDTGDPEDGHTMVSFIGGAGSFLNDDLSDNWKFSNGGYKGYYYGGAGCGSNLYDRYNQTVKKLNQVIEDLDLDGKSDYEKLKAIMYWIVCNVKYDSHYNGEPNKPAGTEYPHDMTGAVLDGYAVCDGYAGVLYYMANKAGLNTLYEEGMGNDERKRHAWNLVEIDGTYYYADPTNAWMGENGGPKAELLRGQKYFFTLYTPDNNEIKEKYSNISQDDYLKEHSVCKGNHDLYKSGGRDVTCETPEKVRYRCANKGCLYEEWVTTKPALGHKWATEGTVIQKQSCTEPEITAYKCTRTDAYDGYVCDKIKKDETKPALGHSWGEGKVTKEATCTEKGVMTYTCSRCGETKTEEIPMTKHEYEEVVVTAPTCTKKGVSNFVCKHCGLTIKRQTAATGHQHTEIRNQKDATCTSEGYTGDTYCKDCGAKLESGTTIPKLTGHQYGDWEVVKEPTCKKYGLKQRVCKICGDIDVDTIDKVDHTWTLTSTTPATCSIGEIQHYTCSVCGETKDVTLTNPTGQHTWELTSKTDATCTKDGEEVYTCKDCGTTKTEVIKATGHQNTEVRNKKDATCEEKGYTGDTYCKDCGEKLETGKEIAALGHTWDEGKVTKEATETTKGEKTYTCKTCGKTRTEEIPEKTHHWDNGTITKEATCTEDGVKTYHCTDEACNETYTEVIPATGHQHTEIQNKKDATCEEDGYTGDTYCKDCKQIINKGNVIKATGHDYGEWVIEEAATCQKAGKKSKTCKTCGKKVTEEIPKLEHVWDEGKITEAATCKKEGTKTYTCKNCNETKTEVIPKTEHQWNNGEVTKKATCKEEGIKTFTCTICGDTKTESIPKTDHQWDNGVVKKEATCTENGLKVYTCSVCGETKEEVLNATGHTWKLTEEQKATCEADGSRTYTCEVCGETKTETVKATGHQFGAWKTIQEQSVFSDGIQERTCSICGKKETRVIGKKLKATIKTNASFLKLKRRQSTKKFVVSGLAKGDSVRSWSSSNKKIVNVSGKANGTCTIKAGSKTGSAKITIKLASGLTKTIKVGVQKGAVTCTSIKNVPKKLTLNRKKSYQLRPVIDPITCTYKAKYKTSNKKIVKVTSKGKITAVKKGKAKITVMVGKKKFVCMVTVR